MRPCDQCGLGWSVASIFLHPSGGVLDLCGHHLTGACAALDQRGADYEVVYRTATV